MVNLSLEFDYYSLGDLVKIKYGKNQKKVQDDENGQYPIFGTGGLMGYSIEYLYDKPSVLIGRKGSIEKVRYIEEPFWTVDTLFYTEVNEKVVIPKFLYYAMSLIDLSRYNEGTSIPSLRTETLNRLDLPIPDLDYQNRVLSVLSKIDKKIEINGKINKNLQKQINILFKSFFINFEFYDGKYQETLFGEIPIEWNIILFKDILNERNEKSTNQDIPMYSVTLDGIQPRADIYKKKITAKTTKFKIIHKYDLIFGMPNSGYQYGIMYDEIGGVSSAYPVFEINGIQPRYVDLFIKNISNYFNDIVKSGSRMGQGIDKKVLLSKEIYVPPNEHLDKYYSIESKLLDLINHNLTEINNLTKLRDTLLPKLMSGEIDITKINCDLELKYNYMKYLFNQIHTPMSKSVV